MKKFLKNPWTISLGTALFAFALTVTYDLIKGKQVLSTIGGIFADVWHIIVSFLTFDLKVWWVLIGIAVVIIILLVISKYYDHKNSEPLNPSFLSYTEDHFRVWTWTWAWEQNSDQKWHVVNLVAHCPKCNTPMFHDSYESEYECPRCKYNSGYSDGHEKSHEVEAIIIDNLNRKMKTSGGEPHET